MKIKKQQVKSQIKQIEHRTKTAMNQVNERFGIPNNNDFLDRIFLICDKMNQELALDSQTSEQRQRIAQQSLDQLTELLPTFKAAYSRPEAQALREELNNIRVDAQEIIDSNNLKPYLWDLPLVLGSTLVSAALPIVWAASTDFEFTNGEALIAAPFLSIYLMAATPLSGMVGGIVSGSVTDMIKSILPGKNGASQKFHSIAHQELSSCITQTTTFLSAANLAYDTLSALEQAAS